MTTHDTERTQAWVTQDLPKVGWRDARVLSETQSAVDLAADLPKFVTKGYTIEVQGRKFPGQAEPPPANAEAESARDAISLESGIFVAPVSGLYEFSSAKEPRLVEDYSKADSQDGLTEHECPCPHGACPTDAHSPTCEICFMGEAEAARDTLCEHNNVARMKDGSFICGGGAEGSIGAEDAVEECADCHQPSTAATCVNVRGHSLPSRTYLTTAKLNVDVVELTGKKRKRGNAERKNRKAKTS